MKQVIISDIKSVSELKKALAKKVSFIAVGPDEYKKIKTKTTVKGFIIKLIDTGINLEVRIE